jgi:hypothetical protein
MELHTLINLASWLAVALFLIPPTAAVLQGRKENPPMKSVSITPAIPFLDVTSALLARVDVLLASSVKAGDLEFLTEYKAALLWCRQDYSDRIDHGEAETAIARSWQESAAWQIRLAGLCLADEDYSDLRV